MTLTTVTPLSSQTVHQNFLVDDHPNFTGPYTQRTRLIDMLASINVAGIRGMLTDDEDGLATVEALRRNGMTWVASLFPSEHGLSDAGIKSKVAWVAENAADVVTDFEGPNEWNNSRSGGTPMGAVEAVRVSKVIWDAKKAIPALSHIKCLAGSCHVIVLQNNKGKDYLDLKAAGINAVVDGGALHSYPGGLDVTNLLPQRLTWMEAGLGVGCYKVLTEFGYSTAGSGGMKKVSEADAAARTARSLFLLPGMKKCLYEAIDQVALGDDDGYGIIKAKPGDVWDFKPAGSTLAPILTQLKDPGVPYATKPIDVLVEGDCQWWVTQRRGGRSFLWIASRDATARKVVVTDKMGVRTLDANYTPAFFRLGWR